MAVQAAMAVVIADGVGGADVGHPSGFEQRDQPAQMLPGDGNGPGDGDGQRAARADGAVEDRINAAQIRAAERGQAVGEQFVERLAFVDAAHAHGAARGNFSVFGHRFEGSNSRERARKCAIIRACAQAAVRSVRSPLCSSSPHRSRRNRPVPRSRRRQTAGREPRSGRSEFRRKPWCCWCTTMKMAWSG